jgi:uncharacterized surface protein with fasciclin (FAS1) repeats
MMQKIVTFAVLFLLAAGSCKKAVAPVVIPITPLQQRINTDTTLSLYHRLILQANETGLLANDSVTLLIPVNAALRSIGLSEDSIDNLSATLANNIVRYDFIPSRVIIPLADSGAYIPYNTLFGSSVYGMSDGTHVWFNGVQAIFDTAGTGAAIIYRLNGLLNPPADSVDNLLNGDSTLTFLAEVFLRTGLDSVLSAGGNFTILAPVNSAWINAGYDSLGAIDSADLTALTQLAEYQVVPGLYFTNTLSGLTSLTTLQGETVTVTFQNGLLEFTGNTNPTPANLLSGNQPVGSTILLHKIDQVLTP